MLQVWPALREVTFWGLRETGSKTCIDKSLTWCCCDGLGVFRKEQGFVGLY